MSKVYIVTVATDKKYYMEYLEESIKKNNGELIKKVDQPTKFSYFDIAKTFIDIHEALRQKPLKLF
jgi:hypothetical protein